MSCWIRQSGSTLIVIPPCPRVASRYPCLGGVDHLTQSTHSMPDHPDLPPLRGVICDMDGVLVDSESFSIEAGRRVLAEHGLHVTAEEFRPFIGTGEEHLVGGV